MRLRAVELFELDLELVRTVESGAGAHRRRPVLIIRVETNDGEGWGECAALAEPTYTSEYVGSVVAVLSNHLIARLQLVGGGREIGTATEAMDRLSGVRGHPMAKAALEMALLDVELRASGTSLASFLGAARSNVSAGETIGVGHPDVVIEAVSAAVALGYSKVKAKITPGRDLEVLRAIRAAHPTLTLAADANGSYQLNGAESRRFFEAIDEVGLAYLEQPLPADDLVGHARLVETLATPIVLDESVESLGELESALALGALDGLSLKPARVGGLRAARVLYDRSREAGLHLVVGGMFESSIGRAAALAFAGLEGFDLASDLGASDRYFDHDTASPHRLLEGQIAIPKGPGLGVEVARDELAARAARVTSVPLWRSR
jgi:O-succinylbenzoate synthase